MKKIRIALIALMLLGVVGGIVSIYLFIFSDGKSDNPMYYLEKFSQDWDEKNDWDEQMFRENMAIIKSFPNNQDVETLRELNTNKATRFVFNKLMQEWETPNCRKSEIDKYMKAVQVIEDVDNTTFNNIDILLLKDIDAVYQKAHTFATTPVELKLQFSGSSWNSFANYASKLQSEVQNIQNNPIYQKYLTNIQYIKRSQESLSEKLRIARNKFRNELASAIIAHYQNAAKTPANLNVLRGTYSRFSVEFGSNVQIKSLLSKFNAEVQAKKQVKRKTIK